MKGDNIELLKGLADNSIDSIVTDCPYGLGKEPNAIELIQAWATVGYLEIKGKGFMGKSWDAFVPQPLFWKEAFRVLKPGGHVAAFFGTRTYDWGTLAIRLAGFEIRDMISWIFGSGFPKSLDVSKAIDKHLGADRIPLEIRKGAGNQNTASLGKFNAEYINTGSKSDQAKQYEGFGTALKPATEPICIARKPLSGTVAQNVLEHGTGGLNLDGCRIEFENDSDKKSSVFGRGTDIMGGNYVGATHSTGQTNIQPNDLGRFPANVILDEYMAAEMDLQSGELTSGKPSGKRNANNNIYGQYATGQDVTGFGDTGGASRFFYCAKSSTSERNAGLEQFKSVLTDDGRLKSIDNAFQRGETERQNFHPTVKPISLMRWLIRLITPKCGICLDPFAGSGTTGCAAAFEGIEIILMEMEPEYIPIIEARTIYWQKKANRLNYEKELLSAVQTLF